MITKQAVMVSSESYIFPLLRSELCAINLQRTHSVYIDSVIKLQLERIGAILFYIFLLFEKYFNYLCDLSEICLHIL